MDPLENDDGCGLDSLRNVGALVQGEVVCGNLSIFAGQKLLQLLVSQVEVEGVWVIEVVVCSIFMLIIPLQQSLVRKVAK